MDSKLESARFAQRHDLPFAQTVATDAPKARAEARALVERHGFPLIAKPVAGNGSRGVLVLLEDDHVERILSRPAYVVQPMIAPPAELVPDLNDGVPLFWGVPEEALFAVRGLIGLDGEVSQCCGYVLTMVMGRAERMEHTHDIGLVSIGVRFGQALSSLGWRGPYNVQCKRGASGEFVAIEINGRFGGGTAGRRYFGYDEVAWAINQWLQGDYVRLDPSNAKYSDLVIRTLDDYAIPADAMTVLADTGQWQS
jgi:carbamoyl-phosphate synthase large subunit